MCVCVCVCARSLAREAEWFIWEDKFGCCEVLIMVQQSGERRPCSSLIMGFHSRLHRLQVEAWCIGWDFTPGTHCTHILICIHFILTNTQRRTIKSPHNHEHLREQEFLKDIKKTTIPLAISNCPCRMPGPLSEISRQFLSLWLPYLWLSQLPTDKIDPINFSSWGVFPP